jgi:hypothetical protein
MASWQDRLRDARGFWDVAEAAHDPGHRNQAVSNAVLAMIAANDAVCLYVGAVQPAGASHAEAARALRSACRGTPWEREAARQSRQLLGVLEKKSAAQYMGRPFGAAETKRTLQQVRRFLDWAEAIVAGPSGRLPTAKPDTPDGDDGS